MNADKTTSDANAVPGASTSESAANQDEIARRANADSLRRQIRVLKEGRAPRSLNEFVEQQMAKDTKTEGSHD